jgi:hypothetical protein
MKVAFLDFWDNFDNDNNFFIHALRKIYSGVEVSSPINADLIIYSCFGNSHLQYTGRVKKVFFTGENKRPDFSQCDYSITFDFDDYNNRNIRIPLWYLYIDWFNVKTYSNPQYLIPVEYLESNKYSEKHKTKFCSAVFSNPVGTRVDLSNKLSDYKKVDCYGKPNEFKIPDGEEIKMDIISDYKFSICFENTLYPGYYTEKLLHAKITGNIPLYYSDDKFNEDFNYKCCLNYNDYSSMEEFIQEIKKVDNDDKLYKEIFNQKLFNKEVKIEEILEKIKKLI